MDDESLTYYALVWSTSLKESVIIHGSVLSGDSKIPQDSRMLYGTNDNDVMKITKRELKSKVTYDVFSTEQKVEYYEVMEEILIPRDVRIIVWDGFSEIDLSFGTYKIVSPQMFYQLVSMRKHYDNVGKMRMPRNFGKVSELTGA